MRKFAGSHIELLEARRLLASAPGFTVSQPGGTLGLGTAMAFAPDGRIFVCQQNGHLHIIDHGVLQASDFFTLTVDSNGERGLLGVAFDPSFAPPRTSMSTSTTPFRAVRRTTASAGSLSIRIIERALAGSEVQLSISTTSAARPIITAGQFTLAMTASSTPASAKTPTAPMPRVSALCWERSFASTPTAQFPR